MKNSIFTFRGSALLFGVVFLLITLSLPPNLVWAASYDYYVRSGASGNGSESDPFGSITDAIDELKEKGGKSIFVGKGSYSAAITLPKGVALTGSDTKDVTIGGLIRMEDRSKLSEITALGGGILALSGADVTIFKVRVKNVTLTGIKGEEGKGKITIRSSTIENARKGMYFQAGNEIDLEDTEVSDNTEEGIDIRENVSGSIRKNSFKNNGESGIEVVLGSSEVVIAGNTFSGNGASGIATQFFQGAKKTGDVRIENNVFNKSRNYGIDCKSPQGGSDSKLYYFSSMVIMNNTFTNNKAGEIAKRCKIKTDEERVALEEEEAKKKLAEEEYKKNQSLSEEELASRSKEALAAKEAYDQELKTAERTRVEGVLKQAVGITTRLNHARQALETRSKALCFLIGPAYAKEASFQESREEAEMLLRRLANEGEGEALHYEESRRLVAETLASEEEAVRSIPKGVELSGCRFSTYGSLYRSLARFIAHLTDDSEREGEASFFTEAEKNLSLLEPSKTARVLFLGELGYYPKLRAKIVKHGDASPFSLLRDRNRLRGLDGVVAHLNAPMVSAADPIPPLNSVAPLPFPSRFADVFSTENIRLVHLGSAVPVTPKLRENYQKTEANLTRATVESLSVPGAATGGEEESIAVNGLSLAFLEYREAKLVNPEALPPIQETKERIARAKTASSAVVVFVSWNHSLGQVIGPERKEVVKQLIEGGADLVIGTGLPLSAESEAFETGRAYYSLGQYWGDFESPTSEGKERSVAVVMTVSRQGTPVFEEKVVSFSEEGALQLSE